jgi:L-amino acid N-acyltransferase YncA
VHKHQVNKVSAMPSKCRIAASVIPGISAVPNPHNEATLRDVRQNDAEAIAAIYNHYIQTSIATFEEGPVTREDISQRMDGVRSASLPWLVAERAGRVIGYAYATPWKSRSAYRFSAEASMYIAPGHVGCGTGSALYAELIAAVRERGIHVLIGGISLPNEASVAINEKFGFRKVAHFSEVGFKFGKWIDVGYWQLAL